MRKFFLRAEGTIREVREHGSEYYFDIMKIERYLVLAEKLMDQVDRRVILDEVIKHEEKAKNAVYGECHVLSRRLSMGYNEIFDMHAG